ncbi:MAG TPA: ABC transporter permease subunit [Chloroflexi bacterium]|nr:ABC transporter permease subunit [Chloroflexota bacterium]
MTPGIITDSWTVVLKEWREWRCVRARFGWGALLLLTVAWGSAAPLLLGSFAAGSLLVPLAWAALPSTLAGAMITDAIAGERERQTLETLLASRLSDRAILLGKVVAITLLGWLLLVLGALPGILHQMLTTGMSSVSPAVMARTVLGVVAPTVLMIVLAGALISLYTPTMRFALLLTIAFAGFLILGAAVLVAGWIHQSGAIPDDTTPFVIAAASVTVVDGVLLGWLLSAAHRDRLLAIG